MALLHRPYLDRYNGILPPSPVSELRLNLAKDAMDTVASEFVSESMRFLSKDAPAYRTTSPLILHWGYEASVHLKQRAQTGIHDETPLALEELQKCLRDVNSRWKAAGKMRIFPQCHTMFHRLERQILTIYIRGLS